VLSGSYHPEMHIQLPLFRRHTSKFYIKREQEFN